MKADSISRCSERLDQQKLFQLLCCISSSLQCESQIEQAEAKLAQLLLHLGNTSYSVAALQPCWINFLVLWFVGWLLHALDSCKSTRRIITGPVATCTYNSPLPAKTCVEKVQHLLQECTKLLGSLHMTRVLLYVCVRVYLEEVTNVHDEALGSRFDGDPLLVDEYL